MPDITWLFWEGPLPGYIALCIQTIARHTQRLIVLDRAGFDELFTTDRDIDIDRLALNHQSDFVRAYLLAHHGGMYVDADCIAMKDLSCVLNLAARHEFVGYREPLGYMSCNFMASKPGGSVILSHYEQMTAKLRTGQRLEWLDLASVPMDHAVTAHRDKAFLLPTNAVMPLSWTDSERLCERRDDSSHLTHFEIDALCYMLSNNTIKNRWQTKILYDMCESDILQGDYFISFLLRRALSETQIEDVGAGKHPDRRGPAVPTANGHPVHSSPPAGPTWPPDCNT
ncbi:MAG: glycosyltransferase [Candidatus Binatia bacterium]